MKTVYLASIIALMGIVSMNGCIEQAPSKEKLPVEGQEKIVEGQEKILEIPTVSFPEGKLPSSEKPGASPTSPLDEVIVDFINSSYSVASRERLPAFSKPVKKQI